MKFQFDKRESLLLVEKKSSWTRMLKGQQQAGTIWFLFHCFTFYIPHNLPKREVVGQRVNADGQQQARTIWFLSRCLNFYTPYDLPTWFANLGKELSVVGQSLNTDMGSNGLEQYDSSLVALTPHDLPQAANIRELSVVGQSVMKWLGSVELEMARRANSWCKNVSRSGGEMSRSIQGTEGSSISSRSSSSSSSRSRWCKDGISAGSSSWPSTLCSVCCVRCVLCALCAAILLGIEFQIEIQQTRNYCQASPPEVSRQHVMYRLFNFSCPRAAIQCEYKNGIILDILFFLLRQNRAISISKMRSRRFKSSTLDIRPSSVSSDFGGTS